METWAKHRWVQDICPANGIFMAVWKVLVSPLSGNRTLFILKAAGQPPSLVMGEAMRASWLKHGYKPNVTVSA